MVSGLYLIYLKLVIVRFLQEIVVLKLLNMLLLLMHYLLVT
uniref:Uncharacterized protein n=1 Tax=Arundo donax TaxID=35708 RepID=A0A0A9E9H0_ARUDO